MLKIAASRYMYANARGVYTLRYEERAGYASKVWVLIEPSGDEVVHDTKCDALDDIRFDHEAYGGGS